MPQLPHDQYILCSSITSAKSHHVHPDSPFARNKWMTCSQKPIPHFGFGHWGTCTSTPLPSRPTPLPPTAPLHAKNSPKPAAFRRKTNKTTPATSQKSASLLWLSMSMKTIHAISRLTIKPMLGGYNVESQTPWSHVRETTERLRRCPPRSETSTSL